ncbi:hypothetical protein [Pararhodonellum marinum]|uniref:hypothetical protein n=1 Tax=Pararhodonellum marinum TaxID=2755358 RepID=UPI00188E9AAC|nr:hypothetical protein [Pararhodonellum marinum]
MKYIFSGLMLILLALSANAQSYATLGQNPCYGGTTAGPKFGLTFQASNPIRDTQVGWFDIDNESFDNHNVRDNSFALGLLFQYRMEDAYLRLRVNSTKINILEYHDNQSDQYRNVTNVHGRQNKITLAPGITWLLNHRNLDLYFGFELPLTLHGVFTLDNQTIRTGSTADEILFKGDIYSEIPSGYSVGVGGIFGFNYFFHRKFSVGAEFSPSLLYAKLGGQTDITMDITHPEPSFFSESNSQDALYGYTFYENRFSFGLSVWF